MCVLHIPISLQAGGMQLVPVTNPFLAREFGTSLATRDIESAAKFIGAGAATVGAAGTVEMF